VSDDGHIILNIWIAIEELVALAENQSAANQKDNDGNSEYDPQRRNAGLFNYRYKQRNIGFHAKKLTAPWIGCSNTSEGFSGVPEGGIATPSSEINPSS
jgi:hypothetical protein